MSLLGLVPLVVALAVLLAVPLAALDRRVDTKLTRVARRYFGRYVTGEAPERRRRLRAAYVDETYRSYAAKTYLVTAVVAVAGAIVGVYVFGGILLVLPAVGEFINQLPSTMASALGRPELDPDLTERQVFYATAGGGVLTGSVLAWVAHWYRWEQPRSHAELRRRGINEGMPRTVAFIYALSRGGMSVPEVLRTLARNRAVYGHGADELSVAVREMDLFGSDIITAVRRVSERTPSDQFKTFAENLASVLQSGQRLDVFLNEQYERYRDEAQDRQDELLELLATIAEVYVTVFVAGTLFLMTILLVFGLTTTQTINFLRLLAYLMIPLGNVLFIVYLDGKLDLLGVARGGDTGRLAAATTDRSGSADEVLIDSSREDATAPLAGSDGPVDSGAGPDGSGGVADSGVGPTRSDGGSDTGGEDHPPDSPASRADSTVPHAESTASQANSTDGAASTEGATGDAVGPSSGGGPNRAGSRIHSQRVAENRKQLELYDSVAGLRRIAGQPLRTVLRRPESLLYLTVPLALVYVAIRLPDAFAARGLNVRVLDDILMVPFLFVIGTFAVVWELYSRRIRRMEEALPELLQRLASLNQAGMSVVESIKRVRESDLGELSTEVDRVWRDIEYGANVDDALRRFGLRVRTTSTTRVVTLLANALRASGSLAPILRIAGEQAEAELKLRRRRRQQMFTYLVVIYISFVVFLVIIVAIEQVLVPSLPTNVPTPSPEDTTRLGVDASLFNRFANVNKAAYTLVFFHTALVQAAFSGFIGGQLGEGSLKDGAKHVTVMLGTAYLVFVLLSSPVAQVSVSDQTVGGEAVVVDSVSLSDGGFVVVRERMPGGEVVGHSDYLEPGAHENVRVELDRTYADEMRLYAFAHLDSDDDKSLGFAGTNETDGPYTDSGGAVYDGATVTVAESSASLAGGVTPPGRRGVVSPSGGYGAPGPAA